jgi:hypothetical protein
VKGSHERRNTKFYCIRVIVKSHRELSKNSFCTQTDTKEVADHDENLTGMTQKPRSFYSHIPTTVLLLSPFHTAMPIVLVKHDNPLVSFSHTPISLPKHDNPLCSFLPTPVKPRQYSWLFVMCHRECNVRMPFIETASFRVLGKSESFCAHVVVKSFV